MADIFISYASEDRERAKVFALALEGEGWSVWWDRLIPFGKPFDAVIQENLTAAKCVVVLWTEHSVASKWVRSEAAAAEERYTLVPVILDEDVQLPLAFKLLQCAKLHDWDPDSDSAEYDKILAQIRVLVSGGGTTPEPAVTPARRLTLRGSGVRRRSWLVLLFLVLPSLLAIGGALVLMNWRVATQIELALQVDRIAFTLAGSERVPLLERAVSFDALSLERLARVELRAARLLPVDPVPGSAERRGVTLKLEGTPRDRMAVDFESETGGAVTGRLSALSVDPGTQVVLEMRQGARPALVMHLDAPAIETSVLPAHPLLLTVSNATVAEPPGFAQSPRWRARLQISEADPIIAVRGIASAFTAIIAPSRAMRVLPDGGAPVSQVELLRQTGSGGYASALVAPARLSYPGYAKDAVTLAAGSLLSIDALHDATLAAITVEPAQTVLPVTVRAQAGRIQSRLGGGPPVDHRLSLFDRLWYGSRTALLFSILVWVASVTVGAYKLYRETRGST
ncbi:MAG: toll/interleukin-1 receptor domain-containing protein [Burkholderiales bacterium]|nr:toll/interleukin-1 receptor domain-containing protein [Burkholderiales bacterium]